MSVAIETIGKKSAFCTNTIAGSMFARSMLQSEVWLCKTANCSVAFQNDLLRSFLWQRSVSMVRSGRCLIWDYCCTIKHQVLANIFFSFAHVIFRIDLYQICLLMWPIDVIESVLFVASLSSVAAVDVATLFSHIVLNAWTCSTSLAFNSSYRFSFIFISFCIACCCFVLNYNS